MALKVLTERDQLLDKAAADRAREIEEAFEQVGESMSRLNTPLMRHEISSDEERQERSA